VNLKHVVAGVLPLCLLSGCFSASSGETAADDATAPRDGSPRESLVRASVFATFPTGKAEQPCQPLGFPVTAFVSNAFDVDQLVDETATPVSEAGCRHEQVLEAPASVWGEFAYPALCLGGSETFCGALNARLCSVELLQRWGSPRSEPVKTRGPTFAFDYVVPPQDEAARAALQRRALLETQTLLDETATVLSAHLAGTRACPDEDADGILAIHADGLDMYRQLSDGIAQR
jgi:hypothetical protein